MQAYGDESGHVRGVLSGEFDYFTIGVVVGDRWECEGAVKRAVRRANAKEGKWNDMTDVQKRRFIDAVVDRELRAVHATVTLSDINRMTDGYLLHESDHLSVPPSCFVPAAMYAAALNELDVAVDSLTVDRLSSRDQSDALCSVFEQIGPDVPISHSISSQSKGVQAADCVAGAARELAASESVDWDEPEWHDITPYGQATIERWLPEYAE